jgi:heparan-alpha-glucosaminide N-acetyltransferase
MGFVERERWLWISLGAILFGYWLAWAFYPAAGAGFNW